MTGTRKLSSYLNTMSLAHPTLFNIAVLMCTVRRLSFLEHDKAVKAKVKEERKERRKACLSRKDLLMCVEMSVRRQSFIKFSCVMGQGLKGEVIAFALHFC